MTRALIAYDHEIFVRQQFGGISRYFVELASRIPRVSPWSVRVLAPAHINSYLRDKPELVSGVFLTPRLRGAGRLSRVLSGLALPLMTRRLCPALMHRTYYSPQPSLGSTCRTVVTVHDMIHELFASEFAPSDATSSNKRRAVVQADHVICVSESTKHDLMTLFDVPAHKISVIHLGYSDIFRSDGPTLPESEAPRPYILYVGQRAGYKGFAQALAAYATSSTLSSSFDFLAFGGQPLSHGERELVASLRLREGAVRRLAGSDNLLSRAYRGAQALIYPSRYEGFGIPALEAMSSGCPVACANTSSLPEVVGEAALCFDPDDMEAMRATLERLCLDVSLRTAMIDAGLHRAEAFSWDRCARQTAAVYAALLRT